MGTISVGSLKIAVDDYSPSWSPDSERIAFMSGDEMGTLKFTLWMPMGGISKTSPIIAIDDCWSLHG